MGFATTCVIVEVAAPLGSVEVLITVINGGVVVISVPLAAVVVIPTGVEKVLSAVVVSVLVMLSEIGP